MRIEVVTSARRLAAIAPEWDALLGRCRFPQVTLSSRWLQAWWEVFGGKAGGGGERELRVVLFRDGAGGPLVGLAPLLWRRCWMRPGVPVRRLELLGSGEDEEDEICSEHIGVLAEVAFEQRVAAALARAIADDVLGPWDELVMPSMQGASPIPTLLAAALRPEPEVAFSSACPYVALPARWDDYLAALGSGGRYLVRRSLRDFERWAGGDVTVRVAETPADLARGRRVLESLHHERWTAAGKQGLFSSARFTAFHDRLMPELLARQELELVWLEARGQPVAALYNVVYAGKVHFYQGGRRMDLPKEIRPGIVLHAHAIRRAIERGSTEYDFLRGTSRYKQDLATDSRPLCTLHATRGPLLPRLRQVTDYATHLARRLRRATTAASA